MTSTSVAVLKRCPREISPSRSSGLNAFKRSGRFRAVFHPKITVGSTSGRSSGDCSAESVKARQKCPARSSVTSAESSALARNR